MNEPTIERHGPHHHLIHAFEEIEHKNALAWSILDTKSESAVVRAIALSANRLAKSRIAHVEYRPRIDLVFLQSEGPKKVPAAYEAKAAYASDFQDDRIQKNDKWLGTCVDDDLRKRARLLAKHPSLELFGALFFIYEVSPTSKLLKYGGRSEVPIQRIDEALVTTVHEGVSLGRTGIDCGEADGAHVCVYMYVFEPK